MFHHTAAAVDFADKVTDLCKAQAKWSQATFGADSERGPIGALRHLQKEAQEAMDVLGSGQTGYAEEMADCLLLVIDAARRGGVGITQLIEAATEKQKVNEAREWPKPVDDTPVEHIA